MSHQDIFCFTGEYFQSDTKCQLLSGVRGQREAQERHAGDEDTGDDQVEEVVESSPSDLDGEGDVDVWLGTTLVHDRVSLARHA